MADFFQIEQDAADHVAADQRAGFFEVGEAEVRDEGLDGVLDCIGFVAPAGTGAFETVLKLGIGSKERAQEVFRPRPHVMFALVPTL